MRIRRRPSTASIVSLYNNPPRGDQTFCGDGSEVFALHETGFFKASLRRCDRHMRTNAFGLSRDGKDNDKTGGTAIEVINGYYLVVEGIHFSYHHIRHVIRYIPKSGRTVCLQ